MPHFRAQLFAISPVALFLWGCTTDVTETPLPEASTGAITAIVSLESVSYANADAPPHATAVARFIKTREGAVDAPTLAMLGADTDLPAQGTCSSETPSANGARAVELLDFGSVSIDTAESTTPLVPRLVPDVTDFISGVVYGARFEGSAAPVQGPMSIRVDGRSDADAFAISIADAHAPANVAFDGDPFDATPLAFGRALDLVVTWTAEPGNDIIYFEVDGGGGERATCAYSDLGTATLPAALFARDGGTLTIHRLHREAILARGIDDGEARFDFARVYSFVSATAVDLSP
ncbi:MAG: hypothetical protein ACRELY_15010 [Polyangiaceae bacterium]